MKIKLRMLQGQFQKTNGKRADEITVKRAMYFIGSDVSCNLRCPSQSISPRHCAIMSDAGRVTIHDLNSETGVFVNDCAINGSVELANGDLLRIGGLEFEVLVPGAARGDEAAALEGDRWRGAPSALRMTPPEEVEKMDGDITDMLSREDESARQRRLTNPDELRYDTAELQAINRKKIEAEIKRQEEEKARQAEEGRKQRPRRTKPAKLPVTQKRGVVEGTNPTEAAQEMLTKIFKPNR